MNYRTAFVLLTISAAMLRGQIRDTVGALTIYTRFAQSPSNLSVKYMKTELEAIMLPFHLRLDWRALESANGRQVASEIVVVSFKGACRADSFSWTVPERSLGWTEIVDGEILPFADVDCDRIRGLMTEALAGSAAASREAMLGRAMARVLAHELYHVLAHTTQHAVTGIAKASYTGAELASNQLRFDEAQLRAVCARPRHP